MNSTFENLPIDLDKGSILNFTNIELQKPSPNYWKVMILQFIGFLLFFSIGFYFFYSSSKEKMDESIWSWVLIGFCLFFAIAFVCMRISVKKKGYIIREHDVIIRSGVISTNTTIIPNHKIQQVGIHEGVLSRIFKLSTVQIFTAAFHNNGQDKIPGIPIETAHAIRTHLIQHIKNTGQNIEKSNE